MSDKKISQLTGASTPLAGTEVLPLVQSGATKKVAVADLTTGRSVSAGSLALTSSPLPATSGGTGQSSAFTADGVAFASSTSAITTGTGLTFNGTNLGLSTTASASWSTNARAIDIRNFASVYGENSFFGAVGVSANAVWTSGALDTWGYKNNGTATRYEQNGASGVGTHAWYSAVSGTAGDPITWVKSVTLETNSNVTVNVGNLVIGTAGKGIDFSADPSAAGMTSELLDDYEEGTWTPTDDSGAGLSLSAVGNYTKVGRQVFWQAIVVYPTTADGSNARIGGFPFTPALGSNQGRAGGYISYASKGDLAQILFIGTELFLYKLNAVPVTNAELSGGEFYLAGSFVV